MAVGSDLQIADDFKSAAWQEDDLYIDEENILKKALGGRMYSNWWLLKPSVIAAIIRARVLGSSTNDINEKTSMLGGTIVVRDSEVIFHHAEDSSFGYADPETILAL